MKKLTSLVLALAMIFTAMLGVVSFAEAEAPENPKPKELVISQASLEFADNVYLLVAVNYSEVGSADGITLKIKNNKTGEEATIDAPATDIKDVPTGCVAFKHIEIGAKNMGDELSIQAYINGTASGDPITYSILEYALRAESLDDAKLTALVKAMIKYGAEAQKAWSHEGTYDLTVEDYSLVKLKGGATFADGTTKAIMKAGDSLTATKADATSTDVWYNTDHAYIGTGKTFSVAYAEDNQTVYKALGTPFDMRAYAGTGVITEQYDGTNYNITDASGAAVSRPTDWIYDGGTALKGEKIDTSRKFIWDLDNDYLEYTKGSQEILFTHSGFFTPEMYEQVVANGGKFTVSVTLATDDLATSLGSFMFRSYESKTVTLRDYTTGEETSVTYSPSDTAVTYNGLALGIRDTGGVSFLESSTKGVISSFYNNYGGKSTANAKYTLTKGEFVTIDIVVDLFAKCSMFYHNKAQTKCYLCGSDGKISVNSTEYRCNACYNYEGDYASAAHKRCETCNMVGTVPAMEYYVNGVKLNTNVVCPSVSAEYFNANLSFHNICAGDAGKLRSIVVSPFDIVNAK